MTSTTPLDLRLAELLASRLCHDLVGPISAIGNGMELLEEGMAELDEEARRLVADSAEQAAASLQFFRLAFGFAGGAPADPDPLCRLLEPFLAHRKVVLDWPAGGPPLPDGAGKLVLNLAALGAEALPTGGRLQLAAVPGSGGLELRCLAAGAGAGLRPEVVAGMAEGARLDELTPRSVQGFYAARVAERLGGRLAAGPDGADRFVLSVLLPA